jgi:hypothetical protein
MRDIVRICNEIKEATLHEKAWGTAFWKFEEEAVRLGLAVTAKSDDPSACAEVRELLLIAIERVDFLRSYTREELYALHDAAARDMREKTDARERVIAFHVARFYLMKVFNLGVKEYPR